MPATTFYPSIVSLLPIENLPASLGPIKDGAETLFESLFYKNLQVEKSAAGDAGFYRLSIIAYKRIGFEIPGTGFALLLNPDDSGLSITDIPVSFGYRWEILKHVKNFNISSFSEAPDAFFQLFLDVTELTPEEMLEEAISVFFNDSDPFDAFKNRFNAIHNSSINTSVPPGSNIVEHLVTQIEGLGLDTFVCVFNDLVQSVNSLDEIIDNLKALFKKWLGEIDIEDIKRLLVPQVSMSIENLNLGILFPTNVFRQVDDTVIPPATEPTYLPLEDVDGNDVPSILKFNVGRLTYSTENGVVFEGAFTFQDFPTSELFKSGFCLGFSGVKVDLSRTTNIPEADADGRPTDFIGAYIEEANIIFPLFWQHDPVASTGVLKGRKLLVGTGGLTGNISMEAVSMGDPAPLLKAKFGQGFEISLSAFELEFQQNAIIESTINGRMKIPTFKDSLGNDAEIDIDIHIGQGGDFSVTATEPDGIPIEIPQVMEFKLKSAGIGRQDDRFFLSISGSMRFLNPTVATLFPADIEFQEIIIWDDGQFEIKGGGLELPQALSLKYPPVELSVTAIHLGSTERDYETTPGNYVSRKYKYFGFDGGVKVDPGGVEAKGKGIQVYYSTDNDTYPLDLFIRIESIRIDIIIPGDADPKDAAVIIAGFLAMKEPPLGLPGTEYAGSVSVDLPQAGIGGAAAMRFNPKVPYFIVDIEVEMSKAIPLGSTGLGLYGFRGLLGKHFVATKSAAMVPDAEPWWKYYKAKIESDYKEGVQISKFDPIGGFSVGLGVSLATATDGGKVFSSKIFLLLSLRELFMLQGQAAILSDRIKLNDPNDPPFFALIVITRESIEAALGVNYLIPDDKKPGSIATVQGVLELGFFFRDSSAWYLNIGRDLPESYRIQVRLFDLFDVYFYFMLNARGIRTGAGASFELDKKFGPLRAYLYAYLDIAAKVGFKPKQLGGSIALGGGVELTIFGLGFGISVAASLAAESPEPFLVTGSLEVCIKVLKKDRCAKFEFTWDFNDNVDTSEIGTILRSDLNGAAQAVNIQTKETFAINFVREGFGPTIYHGTSDPGAPEYWLPPAPSHASWNGSFDDFIIPLDCFIDIDFKNGMNPNGNASTDNFGKSGGANHIQFIAPQKGKTPRVKHDFKAEDILIYAWNPIVGTWEEYDIYDALTPMDDLPFIDPVAIDALNLKQGYWQMEEANKFNKLRILAQTPLSYMTQTSGEFIPENNGVTSESIFCEEEPREKCCVCFTSYLHTLVSNSKTFVNDYSSEPIQFKYAQEFVEGTKHFVYGVGYSGDSAYVLKTDRNGNPVWSKTFESIGAGFKCRSITQVLIQNEVYYIVYAFNGTRNVLFSFNRNGALTWTYELDILVDSIDNHLISKDDHSGCYFVYTDVTNSPSPVVITMSATGNLDQVRRIDMTEAQNGAVVNAVKLEHQKLVLVGELIGAGGWLVELSLGVVVQRTLTFKTTPFIIHDLLMPTSNDYILSGQIGDDVVYCRTNGSLSTYYILPQSGGSWSMLTETDTSDFLIFATQQNSSKVYRVPMSMTPTWEKEFVVDQDNTIDVKSAVYNSVSGFVTLSSESDSLLMRMNTELESCVLNTLELGQIATGSVGFDQSESEAVEFSIDVSILRESFIHATSPFLNICGGDATITYNQLYHLDKFTFKVGCSDLNAEVVKQEGIAGCDYALKIINEQCLEIIFNEPMACVDLTMITTSLDLDIEYYQLVVDNSSGSLEVIESMVGSPVNYTQAQVGAGISYESGTDPIDKLVIKPGGCKERETNCPTYLYKVCVMSEEDYAYNLTIPGSSEVAEETQSMMDALEKTFQPIWRPNTTYAIAIKTNEAVSGGGSDNHRNTFYYGFRTKGPVGHFHSYLDNTDTEVIREDYQDLLDANQEDSYQLSKLQHYIDYRRSYPNADGNLLNAKPLFYLDPKLLLFFKKQYVYSMFGNWDALSGNGAVAGSMGIVIQDAIEPQVPPVPTLSWKLDDFAIKGADVLAINNMIQNSDPSDCPPETLNQKSVNAQVDINELEPLKLYTAIFNNTYQRDADASSGTVTREVHRYPFRTSRYGTFEEQVNSYILAKDTLTSAILKSAVFEVGKVIPAPMLTSASGMISDTPNDDLLQEYAELTERVLQGAFKLGTLHPSISTEFNIVRNTDVGGNLLGVWIRCPEPFNDPKLPESEMKTSIRLSVNGDSESNYKAIFSKDAREVFITKSDDSLEMPTGDYTFRFDYREWNGQQYVNVSTVPVELTIN